jgi:serine/threonine protein kinase
MFQLGKIIGKGSDGEVYELVEKGTISDKVIKFIQPKINGINNYLEPYILLHLKHENIMNALKIEIEETGLMKIIQFKADIDLSRVLKNKLKKETRINYMRQLTKGINFLQDSCIIHGDIKPQNILISNGIIKISDFSLSHYFQDNELKDCSTRPYTLVYRPPEVEKYKICLKSDIWALGCTLYEIFYGNRYFTLSKEKKLYHIENKECTTFKDLIKNMIEEDINLRFDMKEVNRYFNIISNDKKTLVIKKNIEDNMKKIFLNKCNNIENKKVSKKYLSLERELCQRYNFDIYEQIKK